ncbi:MAG TPA: tetratricopeptide repeat protein, partial [Burkholderiales bacterium]|nr:tetratricopeptide repeat protein [Burkholderiales bacterium]
LRLAQLDTFTGRPRSAVRRLNRIVAREPRNLEAWLLLAQTARTVDPAAALRAAARVRRLSPPVPPSR